MTTLFSQNSEKMAASRGRIIRVTWQKQEPPPHEFAALAFPEEEGGFSVFAVHYPGVISQGDSIEEARLNIGEAFLAMLEARKLCGEKMEFSRRPVVDKTSESQRLWIKVDG